MSATPSLWITPPYNTHTQAGIFSSLNVFIVMNSSDSPPECNSSLSDDEKSLLLWIHGGTALISFTMCAVAASAVFVLRLYKYFSYRLAEYQVLSSLFFSLAQISSLSLLGYNDSMYYQISCKVEAFVTFYAVWVKLLFDLCLSFHFFCLTVCLQNFENLEVFYVLFSTLFPVLFSWIPFINDLYGLVGAWCWIKQWKNDCPPHHDLQGTIEQLTLWYGPLFLSLTAVLTGFLIIPVAFVWRKNRQPEGRCLLGEEKEKEIKQAIKRLLPLLAYPAIFFVLSLFPLVSRIYAFFSYHTTYPLELAHSSTQTLYSFFSSLALIIHILLIRQVIRKKHEDKCDYKNVQETSRFTSTGSTYYIVPEESDSENK